MRKLLCSLFLLSLLSGCTTLHKSSSYTASPSKFTVSGAIAARNQHQGWTATFYWVQKTPRDYEILISGPLGSETMTITQNAEGVTFRDGDKIMHAHQAETLLAKETGIRLPIGHLYYWIKGKPAPGPVSFTKRSNIGDIIELDQASYHLEYSQYRNHYPYKIRLIGQQLSVKIIIKQWETT